VGVGVQGGDPAAIEYYVRELLVNLNLNQLRLDSEHRDGPHWQADSESELQVAEVRTSLEAARGKLELTELLVELHWQAEPPVN